MPTLHLDLAEQVTFNPPQHLVLLIADAGQDTGLCRVEYTNGQSFQYVVQHSGRPGHECMIHRLEDANGNVVGLIDMVVNIGAYEMTVDYS